MQDEDAIKGSPSSSVLKVGQFSSNDLQVYEDDYFNDWHGRFYSGTHRGTNFTVTDFEKLDVNQSKGVLSFAPDLSEAVVLGDLFEIYPDYTPVELNDAINLSISMVEEEALQDKVDSNLQIVASTFEYVIPAGFLYIDRIIQESTTAGRYSTSNNVVDVRHWDILRESPAKLWFDSNWVNLTAGKKLRLLGQSVQSQLVLDADLCNISQTYLVYQAKALLHQSKIRGRGADFEEHERQMVLAQGLADRERVRLQVIPRGRKVTY